MARSYSYEASAITEVGTGQFIDETGMYDAFILCAAYEKNSKGTEGISLLLSIRDIEVGPFYIYTHRGDGSTLPGYRLIQSIMVCTGVAKLDAQMGKIKRWNSDLGARREEDGEVYPAFVQKRLFAALQQEEYVKKSGDVGIQLRLLDVFKVPDLRSAYEIKQKHPTANAYKTCKTYLEKNPIKKLKSQPVKSVSGESTLATFHDDDIPF